MTEREVETTISGNKLNGFIVEAHDGDLHTVHPVFAEHEDEALDMALRQRRGEDTGSMQEGPAYEPAQAHGDYTGIEGLDGSLDPDLTHPSKVLGASNSDDTEALQGETLFPEPIVERDPVAGSPVFSDEPVVIEEAPADPVSGAIPNHVAGDLRAMDEKAPE